VLIVDDDVKARTIHRAYLRGMGCGVLSARDGLEGMAKASRHRPDVIVMNLAMPRVDGWTATRTLKRRTATAGIPVIALSATPTSRASARAAGCDAFIAKPCLPELLWCQIRVVLQGRGVMWGEMARPRPSR